jgi:hypothetical protein
VGHFAGTALRYYGVSDMKVVHCLLPDASGRFPGDPGIEAHWAHSQLPLDKPFEPNWMD